MHISQVDCCPLRSSNLKDHIRPENVPLSSSRAKYRGFAQMCSPHHETRAHTHTEWTTQTMVLTQQVEEINCVCPPTYRVPQWHEHTHAHTAWADHTPVKFDPKNMFATLSEIQRERASHRKKEELRNINEELWVQVLCACAHRITADARMYAGRGDSSAMRKSAASSMLIGRSAGRSVCVCIYCQWRECKRRSEVSVQKGRKDRGSWKHRVHMDALVYFLRGLLLLQSWSTSLPIMT